MSCPLKISSTTCCNNCARWCFDVQDACANKVQNLQAAVEVALYLQQAVGDLWSLAPAEARQGPQLTLLPTGKLLPAVTWPRENDIPHSKSVMERQVKIRTSMNKMLSSNTALHGIMQYNLCKIAAGGSQSSREKRQSGIDVKGMNTHAEKKSIMCYVRMRQEVRIY